MTVSSVGVTSEIACSKRSDSGEQCQVKKAISVEGDFYFFALLFPSHRSPLSERLEQATSEKKLELLRTGGQWFV